MTHAESEARFYLCAYQYRIANRDGDRTIWRKAMERANAECTAAENAERRVARTEQIEARAP